MSPASHAVNRLRELYRTMVIHARALNGRLFDPPHPLAPCLPAPVLEPLEQRILLAANLSLVETGLKSGFFSNAQEQLNQEVFLAPAPLVGSQLATEAPGQFLGPIDQMLAGFSPSPSRPSRTSFVRRWTA